MAAKRKRDAVEEVAVINEVSIETGFTKAQLLSAGRFAGRRDLLNALLDENKSYTVKAVEGMIEKYMKGRVI